MSKKKKEKAVDGAKFVGHGLTAIIKTPANAIVKGANKIVEQPRSSKELDEEKSLASASAKVMETKTLSQGVVGLGKGIVKGVTGVITDPIKGAQSGGFKGFVRGMGSGVVGVVAHPVQGVADLMESFDQTIDGRNKKVARDFFSSSLRSQIVWSDHRFIPNVMFDCLEQLQMRGICQEGIFRVPGNHTKIQELRTQLAAGKEVKYFDIDIVVIASLLKLWLRELPDSLIPFSFYPQLIALGATVSQLTENEKLDWMMNLRKIIVDGIRDPEWACLRCLMLFLNKVVKQSEVNKMHAQNLATVIAPNILYRKREVNEIASREAALKTREEFGLAVEIVKVLIEDCEFFFFTKDDKTARSILKGSTNEEKEFIEIEECVSTNKSECKDDGLALKSHHSQSVLTESRPKLDGRRNTNRI